MNYCAQCAAPVDHRIPEGDDRPRYVCQGCGQIHYQNPRIITGALLTAGEQVLLCRRAIEPRKGYWTLPAGFMENGEGADAGALRESWEEAEARGTLAGLYTAFSLPHINQLYLFFRGTLDPVAFAPGPESLEVALFTPEALPWEALAFRAVEKTLRYWLEDRAAGHFPTRHETLEPDRRFAPRNG